MVVANGVYRQKARESGNVDKDYKEACGTNDYATRCTKQLSAVNPLRQPQADHPMLLGKEHLHAHCDEIDARNVYHPA